MLCGNYEINKGMWGFVCVCFFPFDCVCVFCVCLVGVGVFSCFVLFCVVFVFV